MLILNILWPTLALVALIFAVWITMVVQRLGHIKRSPPGANTFASGSSARSYFEPVELVANNFANLFEMPVLYFALVPLLMITAHANYTQAIMAWVFVVLRAVHSAIHIGPNTVRARFMAYLASTIVLSAMWIGFGVDMIAAASAYQHAMAHIAAQP